MNESYLSPIIYEVADVKPSDSTNFVFFIA